MELIGTAIGSHSIEFDLVSKCQKRCLGEVTQLRHFADSLLEKLVRS